MTPDQPGLLHPWILNAAARFPEHTAIEIPPGRERPERVTLSYAELAARAYQLAGHLAALGSGEALVVLRMPRTSPWQVASQLACLIAGFAYTSIDPAFPEARVAEILEDAAPVAVLADPGLLAETRRLAADPARVFDPATLAASPAPDGPLPEFGPERLAYVIYTSGTTGKPKGVMIEHRAIANLIAGNIEGFGLTPQDRVAQNSSHAYDSSVEEIWSALSTGATLVVMDDEAVRLGPDLVSWLRTERISLLCPPPTLLRSSGCMDPEVELPDLRMLYVGGEALPEDVATVWAKGKRLINGYGPTECAVTCTRCDIHPGEPITIGWAMPGFTAWALDENLEPVPDGIPGELAMGGVGLARGYRGLPELTAQKFIAHPTLGRIYRTGDSVTRLPDGAFEYHGRIDAQVKLRGYRIELGEIEVRLGQLAGVRAAAASVQGEGGAAELVAFVVPDDPADPPALEPMRAKLGETLPGYMVPARIGLLEALPTTVSGKLDRRALPWLAAAHAEHHAEFVAPETALEAAIATAIGEILARPAPVSTLDDFFEDLGGDSLRAALLVTLLREQPATQAVTVADIYDCRCAHALAARLEAHAPVADAPAQPPLVREGKARRGLAFVVQTGWLLIELLVGGAASWLVAARLLPLLYGSLGLTTMILLSPLLAIAGVLAWIPASIALATVVKAIMIGAYRPARAPVWSPLYLRHWIVLQTVRLIPWPLIAGTVFQQWALRALGAKIGRGVHIHRGVNLSRGGWDLLTLEDDVALGQDSHLGLVELDRGDVVIAPVTLRRGAALMVRAGTEGHVEIGEGAVISALSSVAAHNSVPAGELWDGVPAHRTGAAPPSPRAPAAGMSPLGYGIAALAAEAVFAFLAALPAELGTLLACRVAGIDSWAVARWFTHPTLSGRIAGIALATTLAALPLTLFWSALLVRWMGRVREGTIALRSGAYLRAWLKTGVLHASGQWLSGTLMWPLWLRLAGMRIGRKCEISTITDCLPEHVSIGEETFFADGIYLGGAVVREGAATFAAMSLSRNTFLGNHAVIPAGSHLPEDILVGIATVADDSLITAGHSRFGHPSFDLPRREVVEMDRSLTHDPNAIRFANRLFWELLRFALPMGPLLAGAVWYSVLVHAEPPLSVCRFWLLALPGMTLAAGAALPLGVLVLKWLLLGRVKPGQHALWSCWCSRWDYIYVVWQRWGNFILQGLEGTLILPWYLRAMGLTIGRNVVLGPGFSQVVDPDMIHLGDGATVNAMWQVHTFEDRVLKIGKAYIGAGATIAHGTVPMYGAVVGEGAHVGPHSVVMKEEHLLPHLAYQGVPTRAFGNAD